MAQAAYDNAVTAKATATNAVAAAAVDLATKTATRIAADKAVVDTTADHVTKNRADLEAKAACVLTDTTVNSLAGPWTTAQALKNSTMLLWGAALLAS